MTGKLLDRMLDDAGLTSDGLRLALYMERLGPGWHRIKSPRLSILLNHRGQKPIRNATLNAMERRWLDWRDGGAAGGYFRFRTPDETSEGRAAAWAEMGWEAPGEEANDAPRGAIPSDPRVRAIPLEGSREEEGEGGGGDARAIDPKAEEELARRAPTLDVSADALRLYLPLRVDPARQAPYVVAVDSLLQEKTTFDWTNGNGPIPLEKRPQYVVDALNDLAASDEQRGHTRPPGDFANLKTKLSILLRPGKSTGPPGGGGRGRGRKPIDQQEYTGTTEWKGFNR